MMHLPLRGLKKALLVVFFVSISLLGTDLEYQIKIFVQLNDIQINTCLTMSAPFVDFHDLDHPGSRLVKKRV